jgi:Tfp pilus assembly protein PilO
MFATIGGIVLVLLIFFFFFIRPSRTELADVRTNVETEERKTISLRATLAHLKELQANAPKYEAELTRIRRYVPQTHQQDNFIFQVEGAGNESGVDFSQVTFELPKPPPEGASVAELRTTIVAGGGYFSIQDFFRRIYSLKRAVRIDNVSMSASTGADGTTTITVTIIARVFFELPPSALGTVVPGAVPGAVPSPTPSPGV